MLFCALFFFKDLLGSVTSFVTTSLYSTQQYFRNSSAVLPVFVRSRLELEKQIKTLEDEIASQEGKDMSCTYVMQENEELRALTNATSSPRMIAGVIGRPPYTPYDTLVLDRGSEDGVVVHAPVFHGKGVAIGYVREAYPHLALVTLFSSPDTEMTVYIFGPNIFTTAYGEGGGVVRLSVPQGIKVEEGNMVVLPSFDTGVLGSITHIQSIPSEPEQHAYVTLNAPLQSIRIVSIGAVPVTEVGFDTALMHVSAMEKSLFTVFVPESERMQGVSSTTATSTSATSSVTTTP